MVISLSIWLKYGFEYRPWCQSARGGGGGGNGPLSKATCMLTGRSGRENHSSEIGVSTAQTKDFHDVTELFDISPQGVLHVLWYLLLNHLKSDWNKSNDKTIEILILFSLKLAFYISVNHIIMPQKTAIALESFFFNTQYFF